jgi:hypothetical protein
MITIARYMQDPRPDDVEIGDLAKASLPAAIRRVGTLHRPERRAVEARS